MKDAVCPIVTEKNLLMSGDHLDDGLTASATLMRLHREPVGPKMPLQGAKLLRVIMNQHLPKGVLWNWSSTDVK